MKEKSGVLIQNEKQANIAVAKVMRITFLIFTLVYLLNVFGIFVIDMRIMTLAYATGSILVRRHIVGGANCTLISAKTPFRLCRTGTCRRLSAE